MWEISTCYILNGDALGDMVAASTVVKYIIDRYHTELGEYHIIAPPHFHFLFPYVPKAKLTSTSEQFTFDHPYVLTHLHQMNPFPNPPMLNLALRNHLVQYAALNLIGETIDPLPNYLPYEPTEESLKAKDKFPNIDFTKSILIPVTFRSPLRSWNLKVLTEVCEWILSQGYNPIFIGSTNDPNPNTDYKLQQKTIPQLNGTFNLVNKTTLVELLNIMQYTPVIMGIDNGSLHLAGMVPNIKIIAGFCNVNPKFRLPIRNNQLGYNCYSVIPDENICNFCQSDYQRIQEWNYTYCFTGTEDCVKSLTTNKWIMALTQALSK